MKASQIVDSEVSDQHAKEANDGHKCNRFSTPAFDHARMEYRRINEPGD
jgi:hypothetical protein